MLWSDIEAIRQWSRGYYGLIGGEGLVIRSGAFPNARTQRRTFARFFISLEWFAPRWWESPLGDDIRRYAPWLFNEGPRA